MNDCAVSASTSNNVSSHFVVVHEICDILLKGHISLAYSFISILKTGLKIFF